MRLPEHRDQGEKDLQTVIADPKGDNAIAHRALAWVRMEREEFDEATRNWPEHGNSTTAISGHTITWRW